MTGEHMNFKTRPYLIIAVAASAILILIAIGVWLGSRQEASVSSLQLPAYPPRGTVVLMEIKDNSLFGYTTEQLLLPESLDEESESEPRTEVVLDENTIFVAARSGANGTFENLRRIQKSDLAVGKLVIVYSPLRQFEELAQNPVRPQEVMPLSDAVDHPREKIVARYVLLMEEESQ